MDLQLLWEDAREGWVSWP